MAQGWQPITTLTWQNTPSTATPLNATNLNAKVSQLLSVLDQRTRTLDSVKLDTTDATTILNQCEQYRDDASGYATSASNSATASANEADDSEAWAVGEKNGVPVPNTAPQYNNNSEFYANQANGYAQASEAAEQAAEDILEQTQIASGNVSFSVNFSTGNLEYSSDAVYDFTINTTTGDLEWEVVV